MHVHTKTHRIPRGHTRKQHDPDGPDKNQRHSGMAIPEKPHRRPIVPRFHWVLLLLHPQLLACRTTPTRLNKKSDPMGLGRSPDKSVRNPENANVHETRTDPTAI